MNKFTSLSAAFAFLAFFATANAAVAPSDANLNTVTLDLTDDITQESITMDALVQLPDGSTTRKTKTYRNMQEAVEGYAKFVVTLPYGSRLIRVQFSNELGQTVFAAQGCARSVHPKRKGPPSPGGLFSSPENPASIAGSSKPSEQKEQI